MPSSIIALNANCKHRKFAPRAFEMASVHVINAFMEADTTDAPLAPANVAIGAAIRRRRKALHLNQIDLAEAIGKDIAAVSRIERGKQTATYLQLVALAKVMRTTVGALDEDGRIPATDDDIELQAVLSKKSPEWRAELLRFLKSQSEQA